MPAPRKQTNVSSVDRRVHQSASAPLWSRKTELARSLLNSVWRVVQTIIVVCFLIVIVLLVVSIPGPTNTHTVYKVPLRNCGFA